VEPVPRRRPHHRHLPARRGEGGATLGGAEARGATTATGDATAAVRASTAASASAPSSTHAATSTATVARGAGVAARRARPSSGGCSRRRRQGCSNGHGAHCTRQAPSSSAAGSVEQCAMREKASAGRLAARQHAWRAVASSGRPLQRAAAGCTDTMDGSCSFLRTGAVSMISAHDLASPAPALELIGARGAVGASLAHRRGSAVPRRSRASRPALDVQTRLAELLL